MGFHAARSLPRALLLAALAVAMLASARSGKVQTEQQNADVAIQADPSSGSVPLTVTLTAVPSGLWAPNSFTWDFGDGSQSQTTGETSVTHVFRFPGGYTVNLSAADGTLIVSADSVTVNIGEPEDLTVEIDVDITAGEIPVEVTFSATVNGGIPPYQYAWDFGDEGTSDDESPTHTYTDAGTFDVDLTITDAADATAADTTRINTTSPGNEPPTANADTAATDEDVAVDATSWRTTRTRRTRT